MKKMNIFELLEQYKNDYCHIFELTPCYNFGLNSIIKNFLITIYGATKNDEEINLKIIDKNALKKEENYNFLINQIN